MIINKTNIKTLLNIADTTYDNRIDMAIPQVLDHICEYCNNDFLLYGVDGLVYEDVDLTIDTTITLDTDIPFQTGDFFRLFSTNYNDGLYQINSFLEGVITIETSKSLRAETIENAIISLVKFPSEFMSLIAYYVDTNIVNNPNVTSKKIDDTQINYTANSKDEFINSNKSLLTNYRKVFKDSYSLFSDCRCL